MNETAMRMAVPNKETQSATVWMYVGRCYNQVSWCLVSPFKRRLTFEQGSPLTRMPEYQNAKMLQRKMVELMISSKSSESRYKEVIDNDRTHWSPHPEWLFPVHPTYNNATTIIPATPARAYCAAWSDSPPLTPCVAIGFVVVIPPVGI